MPEQLRAIVQRVNGLHTAMAGDLARDGDALYCRVCGASRPLSADRWAHYLRHGWPLCCNRTMWLVRADDVRVINIRSGVNFDLYIGRANRRYGLTRSFWANPFKIGPDGDRETVLAEYETYVRSMPSMMARLPELRGKTLACWCAPERCHGDVLAKLVREARDA